MKKILLFSALLIIPSILLAVPPAPWDVKYSSVTKKAPVKGHGSMSLYRDITEATTDYVIDETGIQFPDKSKQAKAVDGDAIAISTTTEKAQRVAADLAIAIATTTENSQRVAEDLAIRNDVAVATTTETSNRIAADNSIRDDVAISTTYLNGKINTEIVDRQNADNTVRNDVAIATTTETSNRIAADNSVRNDVAISTTYLNGKINTEIVDRQNADLAIRSDVAIATTTEASTRENTDNLIKANTAYLQVQVDNLTTQISSTAVDSVARSSVNLVNQDLQNFKYQVSIDTPYIQGTINNEIVNRQNADLAIRSDVAIATTTEKNERVAADLAIAIATTTEKTDRVNADLAIAIATTTEKNERVATDLAIAIATTTEKNDRVNADLAIAIATTTEASTRANTDTIIINSTGLAVITVAANDAPAFIKNKAQYVCDGTNDEVEIQNALNYLNSIGGGKLQLERGNYSLSDSGFPITIYSNTIITGQGQTTVLSLSYSGVATLFNALSVSNVTIENILFNPLTYILGDFMVSASGNNVRIKNNVFNTCSMGVYFTSGSSNCYVSDNIFRFNDIGGYGIYFNGTVGSACGNINITGNHIFGTSLKPIHLTNVENSFVIGNTMENSASGSDGEINIDNCINIVVKGNIIRPTDYTLIGRGINVNSGSTRISVEGNIVTQRDYGFYVIGTSCTITGNIAYDCNIANALINVFTNKEDVNSWDSDNAKQSDLTATQISTGTETVARIAGDVAIGGTTNYLYQQIQSTRAACVAGDIAIGISTAAEASTRASGDSLLGAATGQIAASVAVSSATEALARQAADEVIGGTTSYLYQQIQSTRAACLAGDIAIGLSTATEASTRAAADSALGVTTGTLNTAISTTAVMAFSVSTSAVRTGVDGDILATTGKVDIGTEEYSLIYTTYTLDMPIALSSNTETGDFGEFESASSFTVIDVFFTSRTTAPISNVTFTCQRQTSGNNIMNGSMLLTGGLTQSTVFVSTNVIPAMDGIRVIATGRSNGIVHAVFRVFKKRGQ